LAIEKPGSVRYHYLTAQAEANLSKPEKALSAD